MRFPEARILIFCKAPLPGRVKTRLIPSLSPEQAAELHRQMALDTLAKVSRSRLCPAELWCAPDTVHPFFAQCGERFGVSLRPQRGKDLGERMHRALENALGRSAYALLMGSDIPSLTAAHLEEALSFLEQGADAVIGPAEDGGYVLIGLRRPQPALFENMPWGEDRVLEESRRRMHAMKMEWRELPVQWDIDRPGDLHRLWRAYPGIPAAAGLEESSVAGPALSI